MKKIISILIVFSLTGSAWALPTLETLKVTENNLNSCESNCFSIEEAARRAKTHNLESLKEALKLYKARETVNVKLGMIIPHLNLKIITEPWGLLDLIPGLLGFLFPSNWFHWKESKLYAKAQRYSYLTFLGNQVQTVQNVYYNTHLLSLIEAQHQKQIEFLGELLEYLIKREENGEISFETVELAKSKMAQKEIDLLFISQAKREVLIDLAEAMNLKGPWDLVQIQDLPLKVPEFVDIKVKKLTRKVFRKSYQRLALKNLEKAAEYSKKARAWSFLTPDGEGSGFGFGMVGQIRLGRAGVQEMKLEMKSYENRLKKTLFLLKNQFESIKLVYDKANEGTESTFNLLDAMREDFLTTGEINFNDFFENMEMLFGFQYASLLSKHAFMEGQSKIRRLLRKGKEYSDLESFLPEKKDHKFKFLSPEWREERKIKKAIKKRRLKLPLA